MCSSPDHSTKQPGQGAGLVLRHATIADLAMLDGLYSRAYPALLKSSYPPSTLVLALPLIARANPRLLRSGTFWVAEREGAILGAGGWSWTGPQGGVGPRHMAHMRHLVTHPDHVRQGIGTAIVAHVLDEAAAAGVRLLDCQATMAAVPFYAALGFREIGPVVVHLRPGIDFPAMRMQRRV